MEQTRTAPDDCAADLSERIAAFLAGVGVPVSVEPLPDDTFLPGILIRDGTLVYDPARLDWPGDLLHEAGHIAVTDPTLRPTLSEVPAEPGEEMAAIAWSYAAALAAGIDPELVFHGGGYRNGGDAILVALSTGGLIGQPMLQWWGMTRCAPDEAGGAVFPAMSRWLR